MVAVVKSSVLKPQKRKDIFVCLPFVTNRSLSSVFFRYHVTFFDHFKTNVSRAWIPARSVHPFCPGKDAPQGQIIAARMSKRLAKSVKQAELACELNVAERRKKFSFLARHSGQWGEAMSIDNESI